MREYTKSLMNLKSIPLHIRETVCEEMCHGVEVSNLAIMIAKELGESEQFCKDIASAGILHDIGKIKLTKYLYAEDGLMVEQMKYVRQHTAQSYEIIRGAGYDTSIAKAVYYHHENYDGSGYPDGLHADNIPWMAKILRVCDVFIALTTKRSYRNAFDEKTALEIMIDEVKDYDMEVFLAFQRVIHNQVFKIGLEQMKEITVEEQKAALLVFEEEVKALI